MPLWCAILTGAHAHLDSVFRSVLLQFDGVPDSRLQVHELQWRQPEERSRARTLSIGQWGTQSKYSTHRIRWLQKAMRSRGTEALHCAVVLAQSVYLTVTAADLPDLGDDEAEHAVHKEIKMVITAFLLFFTIETIIKYSLDLGLLLLTTFSPMSRPHTPPPTQRVPCSSTCLRASAYGMLMWLLCHPMVCPIPGVQDLGAHGLDLLAVHLAPGRHHLHGARLGLCRGPSARQVPRPARHPAGVSPHLVPRAGEEVGDEHVQVRGSLALIWLLFTLSPPFRQPVLLLRAHVHTEHASFFPKRTQQRVTPRRHADFTAARPVFFIISSFQVYRQHGVLDLPRDDPVWGGAVRAF